MSVKTEFIYQDSLTRRLTNKKINTSLERFVGRTNLEIKLIYSNPLRPSYRLLGRATIND